MAHSKLIPINDLNFDAELKADDGRTFVLEFGAPWCAPCKAMLPVLERLAGEEEAQVRVGTIDIEESPTVATRFGVRGVPTIVVFRDGREHARQVGSTTLPRLRALL